MAAYLKIAPAMVQRIWREHNLQPHRARTFKLSNDPKFVEKIVDVVGLYLRPPEQAMVLCVDEKSQIQALDRTQPGLPLKRGRCGTMTHDYKRHGTTTLFAAFDVAEGHLIGRCMKRHRHQEYIQFLKLIDTQTPRELAAVTPSVVQVLLAWFGSVRPAALTGAQPSALHAPSGGVQKETVRGREGPSGGGGGPRNGLVVTG